MRLFSPDSKFTQLMTSFGEMILLNLCWLIASLPVVTMGAAVTAMYTLMGRRLRGEGSGTVVPFFQVWRGSLKAATPLWLAQLAVSGSLALTLFLPLPKGLRLMALVLLVVVTLLFSMVYPQVARFRNRWFPCLRNSVILLVMKLGWVALNLLVFLSPALFFLLDPVTMLRLGFVWPLCGFSALFYLSAHLMRRILQPLESLSRGSAA